MEYKTFILSLILCIAISIPVTAQDELEYRKEMNVDLRNTAVIGVVPGLSSRIQEVTRSIEGSPYYDEEWAAGIALLPNNLKSKGVQMMYDTYNNQVYYKEDEKLLMLDNSRVEGFALNLEDSWILFKNGYKPDGRNLDARTFFRVVHDGKTKILVHHRAYVRESHKPAIATGRKSKEFRHSEDYYLQTEDGRFHEVKTSEKKIVGKLNKKFKKQVKEYADNNDLRFDRDRDLAMIMSFYDKLISKETENN